MAAFQDGPLPTKLTLLSDLANFSTGAKARFLGCVASYSTKTATLTLEHNHPRGSSITALVDVKLLLNTIKSHETRVGEWVNVIGYVTSTPRGNVDYHDLSRVEVQALVLWSSGTFDLHGYERSLDLQKSDGGLV